MDKILLWLMSTIENLTLFVYVESNFDRKFKFKIHETLKQLIEEYRKEKSNEKIYNNKRI